MNGWGQAQAAALPKSHSHAAPSGATAMITTTARKTKEPGRPLPPGMACLILS